MKSITVLISGGGSNLQAIIDAIQTQSLTGCEIRLVLSNRKLAHGLVRAKSASIPTIIHSLAKKDRAQYDLDLAKIVMDSKPDLIVLAGFMHILSKEFLEMIDFPIINLHPALPGGILRVFDIRV
jgi:folate-dependent phosphoribosylglycinamide formyltransferase PurN